MQQTVIKVGNSLAVTLPSAFVKMRKIKAGQKIYVNSDPEADLVQLKTTDKINSAITPEFYNWLNKFNAKYKNALTDLAKKVIVKYITLEELIAIHDSMNDLYGGTHGIRDLNLLQSALAWPQSSFSGEDLYPEIFDKAAALFNSLMFNHAFVDGNKRTTFTSTARFLSLNGYEVIAKDKEIVDFALLVENEHLSVEQISDWLKKNSKKKK